MHIKTPILSYRNISQRQLSFKKRNSSCAEPVELPPERKFDICFGNIYRVDNNVYRGAMPLNVEDFRFLVSDLGIKTIISVKKSFSLNEESTSYKADVKEYFDKNSDKIQIIEKTNLENDPKEFQETLEILKNPENAPCYVHCASGKRGTGLLIAGYRIDHHGWSFDDAYDEYKNIALNNEKSYWGNHYEDPGFLREQLTGLMGSNSILGKFR